MDALSRRRWLMTVPLGGLGLWAARAFSEDEPRALSGKHLIVVWLDGGPSQLETFDPKPGTKIGGPTQSIRTRTEGLMLAQGLERLADLSDRYAIVRSVAGEEGDHERATHAMKTGYRPDPTVPFPTLGAICSAELPVDGTEIPRYVAIGGRGRMFSAGYLGPQHDAFRIVDPARPLPDLTAFVDDERFEQRLSDLAFMDASFADAHPHPARSSRHAERTEAALTTMRSEQLAAFDLTEEPRAVVNRYGDSPFGRGCLAARRLTEVGARCVEVTLGGWDTHIDHFDSVGGLVSTLDTGLSALLEDLDERDRLRDTVVLCAGEFGRTPRINATDGRDHFPQGFSVLIAGGGIRAGQVLGETSPDDGLPKHRTPIASVTATVLTLLDIAPGKTVETSFGRPIKLSDGSPIAELVS